MTANPNNVSSSYISQTSATISVQLGVISSNVNFGFVRRWSSQWIRVTRDGTNPRDSVVVIGNDANDVTRDQEVTNSSGKFLLINLSTGQYTVEPVLGSGESSSPAFANVVVTAGATVSVGTFTVTGVFGTVRGNVLASGAPIRTGVVILCTTTTISATPPALSSATLTGAGYYMTNSYEDGTYSLDVVGSTSTDYKLYGYAIRRFNGTVASTTVRSLTNVSIVAGNTTNGIDFAW